MTSDEAKQALKEGKKVKCILWGDDPDIHYIDKSFGDVDYVFEKYKDDDWEIVE